MAFTLKTLHFALLVTLVALQCRPALLGAIRCEHSFSILKSLTRMLSLETAHLLKEYMAFHGLKGSPSDIPDYSVMGSNFSEQLQDMYSRNVVFNQQIMKVEEYQMGDWGNPKNVAEPLNQLKGTLFRYSNILMQLAQQIYPEVVLTTVEPLHQIHNHSWAKKMYGWKVIIGLKDWITEVHNVLEVTQGPCDNHTAGAEQA